MNYFCCNNLVKINNTFVECCGTGSQMQIPHTDKLLIKQVIAFLKLDIVYY